MTETNIIDALLERYLLLLNEYTTLQIRLANLHGGVYQNLAKANFSAERGIRYGKDYYDDRMHSARRVVISSSRRQEDASLVEDRPPVVFRVACGNESGVAGGKEEGDVGGKEETEGGDGKEGGKRKSKSKDPLRWFGILTPLPLRQAQKLAVESVEEVVPRLATVIVEMAGVELEVRRARKRRAKAEAAVGKEKLKQQESRPAGSDHKGVAA
ncbi:coiled-coil domain-containing protein [Podospora aff. communis PSN243]|uniref:Vacuolar ATPase assembly protein VMA22 n=1 Tax=Podospora aff. communis PSN243 TaxID=3040156 RepID=A0AAV9FYI8_9PEZI|nr:coiled-coil domain-containing protein [Podospora aff. communis PSN243]